MIYYFNTGAGNNYLDSYLCNYTHTYMYISWRGFGGSSPWLAVVSLATPRLSHTRSEEKAGM